MCDACYELVFSCTVVGVVGTVGVNVVVVVSLAYSPLLRSSGTTSIASRMPVQRP